MGPLNAVPPHPHLLICSRHRERADRSGSAGNQGAARRGRPPSSSTSRHVGPAHPPPASGSALPRPPPMADGVGRRQSPLATRWGTGADAVAQRADGGGCRQAPVPSLTHGAAPAQRGGAEARGAAWRGALSRCGDVTAPPERGARRCLETRRHRGEPADNGGSCGAGSARGPGAERALSPVRLLQARPSCPAGQ